MISLKAAAAKIRSWEAQSQIFRKKDLALSAKKSILLAEINARLKAKKRGAWQEWLDTIPMHRGTASRYIALSTIYDPNVAPAQRMSIENYLKLHQNARKIGNEQDRQDLRDEWASQYGHSGNCKVHHADNRKFDWPKDSDIIVFDPFWDHLEEYEWAAGFAKDHLKEGGLCFVQFATKNLPDVMAALSEHLNYFRQCVIVYAGARSTESHTAFAPAYRPVLSTQKANGPNKKAAVVMLSTVPIKVQT